jgi:hypothetical protein
MPNVPRVGLELEQPYYDTISLAVAATTGTFFTVPFGGILVGAVVKGYEHTNLIQAGRLETGYSLNVDAISIWFPETATRASEADIQGIQSGYFQLSMSDTIFLTVPIAMIPDGGAELIMFSNIAAAVTEYQLNKGQGVTQNRFYLRKPIPINPQQTFKAVIGGFHTAPAAATKISCALWGVLIRPVVG